MPSRQPSSIPSEWPPRRIRAIAYRWEGARMSRYFHLCGSGSRGNKGKLFVEFEIVEHLWSEVVNDDLHQLPSVSFRIVITSTPVHSEIIGARGLDGKSERLSLTRPHRLFPVWSQADIFPQSRSNEVRAKKMSPSRTFSREVARRSSRRIFRRITFLALASLVDRHFGAYASLFGSTVHLRLFSSSKEGILFHFGA